MNETVVIHKGKVYNSLPKMAKAFNTDKQKLRYYLKTHKKFEGAYLETDYTIELEFWKRLNRFAKSFVVRTQFQQNERNMILNECQLKLQENEKSRKHR